MIITLILTIAVTIIAVMFSLENVTMIHIKFFGYPIDGSSGLLMLIALGVGVLVGMLLMGSILDRTQLGVDAPQTQAR